MKIEETVSASSGLYTMAEAAMYARIHPKTLNNWLYGNKGRGALRQSIIPKDEGKFLTFLEFVEALAIRNLRKNYNVPLQRIRDAIEHAKRAYNIDYPFANRDHQTFRIGNDLHIILKGEETLIQLSGKGKGQESMRPCLEQFMYDLEWDESAMACAYVAYRYSADKRNIKITMRPTQYFGTPIVEGTGYSALTLWEAALAEGSEKKVAEYYEIDTDSVIAACRYCEGLQMAA